ncbi:uncharacterized protein BYT42DRAFT_604175 [Radiomyces spectabilis]|uniref:uncharacterized protein n=1 Tax=Radiomyces spectabilis TaxID=64574 RepID=UPI0022205E07|nr:uncharacterized protein BYT42DRAFT_604175 [Radiomyces spectabilis]KAI8381158.1 hypothetical protein BYT42DRAFT_604175 [Radiomyces spectabilis]
MDQKKQNLSLDIQEAILSPLFEDLDNSIAFRWTSLSDDEKQANIRPDAIHQHHTRSNVGRTRLVGRNASDKHKLKSAFIFLVVGKNATLYIVNRAKSDLYTISNSRSALIKFQFSFRK